MPTASVLFVCLGNICRSPTAEVVLRDMGAAAGLNLRIDSAGTGGWHAGEPPDRRSIATAARHGVDISGLRARKLHLRDYRDFDWLLCADRDNLADVRSRAPADATARSALLLDWAGQGTDAEVPDPYTGGSREFDQVWAMVEAAARAIVARFADRGRIDA